MIRIKVESALERRKSLGWRDIADGFQQLAVVEPVDPFERRELDGLETPPRPAPMNDLGLVKRVDRFGERVVVGLANAADRELDACIRQAFNVFNREVLAAAVA
ncbi:hypothetical protein M2323_001267 [Rhodoblastus acidophilus]|nr:hypothetical protein [Rhodoblastus acidophilus]MCW2332355.1 hypothetical protein [Rhodoblastus acidophilus]